MDNKSELTRELEKLEHDQDSIGTALEINGPDEQMERDYIDLNARIEIIKAYLNDQEVSLTVKWSDKHNDQEKNLVDIDARAETMRWILKSKNQ